MSNNSQNFSSLQFGNIVSSNGTIQPITSTDIRFENLTQNGDLPPTFLIHISSKHKNYRIVFHTNQIKAIKDGQELLNIPADCDLNTQQGKSLVELWQGGKNVSRDRPPPPLLVENKTTELPDCYVTRFDDERAKIVRLTGGKGCSLAMLTCLKSDEVIILPNFFLSFFFYKFFSSSQYHKVLL